MSDTTRDPIISSRQPLPWLSWQRSEDYYSEGQLMWLEIDTLIRENSHGRRSLDDFARAFFAPSRETTSTYRFEDVVTALDQITAFDWRGLITARLESREEGAHLEGLERGGYKLVYKDTPSALAAQSDALDDIVNLRFSLGLAVSSAGLVQEVLWESPAFAARMTAGMTILAVNGRAFTIDEIWRSVAAARDGAPLRLHAKRGSHHYDVEIGYRRGHRFPHLEPIVGAARRLDDILNPR